MRLVMSSLVVLMLALAACASDPELDPAPPANAARVPVPLTSDELAAYRQELGQVFSRKTTSSAASVRSAAGGQGRTAEVDGLGNVALVKFDGAGGLATTCADNEQDAVDFLTNGDGLEVK